MSDNGEIVIDLDSHIVERGTPGCKAVHGAAPSTEAGQSGWAERSTGVGRCVALIDVV